MNVATALAPVKGAQRIEVLDVLRGLAILGIFYMNIPWMGGPIIPTMHNPAALGWTPADRASWMTIQILLEGTQRCLLEFLFGAGMMVLTAKAMTPDGPVAIADLYYRRNLWLLAFGLFDVFGLLWPGDILHIYALAALILFPFRKLGPRALVAIGSIFAVLTFVSGTVSYVGRVDATARHQAVVAKLATHRPLSAADKKTETEWAEIKRRLVLSPDDQNKAKMEVNGHHGGFLAYAGLYWFAWTTMVAGVGTLFGIGEAFCAMCIGVALWKWGIIQGERAPRFYVTLALIGYAIGISLRWIGAEEVAGHTSIPKTIWATNEIARLAMGLGHVGLVNWAMTTRAGHAILSPFKAAGRTAFSVYFLEQIIGLWVLFAPWGFNLWGHYSYAGLAVIATAVSLFNLVLANVWVRTFANGPLEWLWRSLAYVRWQPFRAARATVVPGPGPTMGVPLPAE